MNMGIKQQTKTITSNQEGFASMVIALILVLILGLMTLGFAQLARREQQNTLSKQLAYQANNAAESAINDAIIDIKAGTINVGNAGGGTTCIHPATGQTSNQAVEPAYGVSYSCLLVNVQPPTLIKQPLAPDKAWTIAFNTSAPPATFKIQWKSVATTKVRKASSYTNLGFAPSPNWGASPAVLQVSLTPLSVLAGTSRDAMTNNTFTAFLYPSSGAGTTSYTSSASNTNAPVVNSNCTAGANTTCSATINMGVFGSTIGLTGPYLLHILDYYDSSNIIVSGTAIAGLGALKFIGGQAQIDVTGKAQTVLKRLQARVPLNGVNDLPSYAAEAGDLCKRAKTAPVIPLNPTGTVYDSALSPACAP